MFIDARDRKNFFFVLTEDKLKTAVFKRLTENPIIIRSKLIKTLVQKTRFTIAIRKNESFEIVHELI